MCHIVQLETWSCLKILHLEWGNLRKETKRAELTFPLVTEMKQKNLFLARHKLGNFLLNSVVIMVLELRPASVWSPQRNLGVGPL